MKRNQIIIMALTAGYLLAGCGGANAKAYTWDYEGETQKNAITLSSSVSFDSTANMGTLVLPKVDMLFSEGLDKNGVMLFDADAAKSAAKASDLSDVPYQTLKENKIEIASFTMPDDLYEFKVTFNATGKKKVGALVHRDYTYRDRYVLLTPYRESDPLVTPIEVDNGDFEFEEKYLKSEDDDTANELHLIINVVGNLANAMIGIGTGNPSTAVGGVLGLFNTIFNRVAGGPDIGKMLKDIIAKLNAMDKKLDALSKTLAKNYEQLLEETIKTQGLVQDVMIRQMNSDVVSFQETYINQADNIRREAGIYLQSCYRDFVNSPETVEVSFRKNDKNEYERVLYADYSTTAKTTVNVTIPSTLHSQEFLTNNEDTLKEGFFEAFAEDVSLAVDGVNAILPSDMPADVFKSFLSASIQENFMKKYWKEHAERVVKYTDIIVNMCRRINANDGTNILDSYLNRLKYMCNFSNETYNMAKSILASLLYVLDSNACNALLAGRYLHVDQSELVNAYVAARKNIKAAYENWSKIPEHYSFVVGSVVSGDAVSLMWDNKWSNLGNDPTFNTSLRLDRLDLMQKGLEEDPSRFLVLERRKYSEWNILTSGDYLKMSLRTKLMKELGLLDGKLNFVDYLVGSEIMGTTPINAYKEAVKLYGGTPYENALFITPVESRALQDSDKGLELYCDGNGTPASSWYKVGQKYKFKVDHGTTYWTGTGLECATVSVKTGTVYNSKQLVSAYACYNESEKGWKNDEHWSFTMGNLVNPYFVLHY